MKINITKLVNIMTHIFEAAPAIVAAIKPVVAEIRKPTVER